MFCTALDSAASLANLSGLSHLEQGQLQEVSAPVHTLTKEIS